MSEHSVTIAYDPSLCALFRPESRPPLAMSAAWSLDAIAAEFSRLAYIRFEKNPARKCLVTAAVGAIGFGRLEWFSRTRMLLDAQAFAAIDAERHAIVAFRGTSSFNDFLTDIWFGLERWDGAGRVHSGFWRSLEMILEEVRAWLKSVEYARLTITGHSLGAAMATLLATLEPKARLVTFGSPRVGDADFAAALEGRDVRRYVDTIDAVTGMPPPLLSSHHVGAPHYIDRTGAVHTGAIAPSWLAADREAAHRAYAGKRWRWGNVPLRRFADHAPINYVSAILGVRTGP